MVAEISNSYFEAIKTLSITLPSSCLTECSLIEDEIDKIIKIFKASQYSTKMFQMLINLNDIEVEMITFNTKIAINLKTVFLQILLKNNIEVGQRAFTYQSINLPISATTKYFSPGFVRLVFSIIVLYF